MAEMTDRRLVSPTGCRTLLLVLSGVVFSSAQMFTSLARLRAVVPAQHDLARLLTTANCSVPTLLTKAPLDTDHTRDPVALFGMIRDAAECRETLEADAPGNMTDVMLEQFLDVLDQLPDYNDVIGATLSLIRLQDTYKLTVRDIAFGKFGGGVTSRLTALDCYTLGAVLHDKNQYRRAIDWLELALTLPGVDAILTEVYDNLAYSYFQSYRLMDALYLTEKLIALHPKDERLQVNLQLYLGHLEECLRVDVDQTSKMCEFLDYTITMSNYKKLCRGEHVAMRPDAQYALHCDLTTNGDPRLVLAPAKREIVLMEPLIVIYHDVVSQREMKDLREGALPLIDRSKVFGELEVGDAEYRIAQTAWLDDDSELRMVLRARIEALTQLDTELVEETQVCNYGLGGHFAPHLDHADYPDAEGSGFLEGTRNRVATFLMYLSDVTAGGATVFPRLGLKVAPEAGSAVFWYNLFKSGEGDPDTLHAGCPVLIGEKWVANKWFHEAGQELVRPCGPQGGERFSLEDVRWPR